jgi:para-nitrobenzyl esterase
VGASSILFTSVANLGNGFFGQSVTASNSVKEGTMALSSPALRLSAAAIIAAASAAASPAPYLPPGVPDVVTFVSGPASGVRSTAANLRYWLSVPYAATTAGANMFLPPQPRGPWPGTLDASQWGPGCLQPHHNPDCPTNQSLDCLAVNIFAPATPAVQGPLPVMVFIHGGAWLEGSGQGPFYIYSGIHFASTNDVVVVTINYRLDVFGWLHLGDSTEAVGGNFGTQDEIAALKWVRDNIAAVGGDPTSVTVFGESAGAMSIGILLTSPLAEGLFHRAIMESNVAGFNYKNTSEAAVYGSTFCADARLNCTHPGSTTCDVDCLRAADPHVLMNAWDDATGNVPDFIITNLPHVLDGLLGTGPVIDGTVIADEPLDLVEGGSYWGSKVPVLLGTNSNEGETFIFDGVSFELPGFLVPFAYLALFGYNQTIVDLVGAQPRYNSSAFADGRIPLSHVVTDYWFRCASERFLAAGFAASGGANANLYAYRYAHVYSNSSIFPTFGLPEICATEVCHASELPFVFHNVPAFTGFTPEEDTLSATMNAYWANFAKTGSPNAPGLPTWPAWEPVGRQSLVLDTTIVPESTAGMCGFWDSVAEGYFF